MTEAMPLTTRVEQFVRTIRDRNLRETIAALFVAGFFGGPLLTADRWQLDWGVAGRIVLAVAALGVIAVCWGRLAIPRGEPEQFPPQQFPEHWRRRMTVQACGLQLAWLWYVAPLNLGALMILLAGDNGPTAQRVIIGIVAVVSVALAWVNAAAGKSIAADRDQWFPRRPDSEAQVGIS